MIVNIETKNLPFVIDLQSDSPEGVNVRMQMEGARSWGDTAQSIDAILNIAAIAFTQFLPWFIAKLRKHKPKTLKINGVEIQVDEATIEAVVKKLLTEGQQSDKE